MGLHAIRLIFKYLPIAVREPGNIEARGHMLIASSLAGLCFGNTMCGGVHAMAHALGGKYGVPHGMGNGIMLPIVMEFNIEAAPLRFLMIADAMGINVKGMDPVKAGKKAVKAVKELKKEIGLTETLKDFNISKKKKDLLALVEIAAGDSQISYNPRYLEEADILKLYLKAF
jgi:alcohol dehydrogenase